MHMQIKFFLNRLASLTIFHYELISVKAGYLGGAWPPYLQNIFLERIACSKYL
jgi:hypothetical protein